MTTADTPSKPHPDQPDEQPRRIWPSWTPWLVGLVLAALIVGVGSWLVYARDIIPASMNMTDAAQPPPVVGYHDGQQIQFIHTEASDPQVADMLTGMMNSPVFVVPSLAQVPDQARGAVYVFTNGIQPDQHAGPFGFQPDVFDSIPDQPDYTPLRTIHLVSWQPEATPRILRSADEVAAAASAGSITIEQIPVVANMPITQWPGGER